jgi:hypothetical protein
MVERHPAGAMAAAVTASCTMSRYWSTQDSSVKKRCITCARSLTKRLCAPRVQQIKTAAPTQAHHWFKIIVSIPSPESTSHKRMQAKKSLGQKPWLCA